MDHDRPARSMAFRRNLTLAFAAVAIGIAAAVADLYGGAGDEAPLIQAVLAVFLVALAALIYAAVFARDA